MRAVAALLAVVALAPACAIRTQRVGDPRLLDAALAWRPGEATAEDVARALGPPDVIWPSPDGFRFVYRAARRVERGFLISAVVKLFVHESRESTARTVLVAFDSDGRLRTIRAAPILEEIDGKTLRGRQ